MVLNRRIGMWLRLSEYFFSQTPLGFLYKAAVLYAALWIIVRGLQIVGRRR